MKHSRKYTVLGIIFSMLGLLLFAYFVRKAGVREIVAGVRRLGWGFLLVFALGGVRQAVHAFCWVKCCEPPYRLRFIDAFKARLMGEAIGNIVPLGGIVSEPTKPFFIRDRVPLVASVPALAIENIFYALSVALFISAGALALLLSFPLPASLRYASIGALIAVVLTVPAGALVIRRQLRFLSGGLRAAANWGIAHSALTNALPRAEHLEDRLYGFYERHHARFFLLLAVEMCFHVAGVVEGYVTLFFISAVAPTLLTAFILESVNRVITVAFKFIPLRAGVDEAGTSQLAKVLGFTTPTAVTLAVVRKGRDICWAMVGIVLIFYRGISLRSAMKESEEIVDDEALAESTSA